MQLFMDQPLTEEQTKFAAIARMDSNAENWPRQLLHEAYRQLPFLSEYGISVQLPRTTPEQGYAVGYIDVKNQTERTPADELLGQPVNHSRIPIVIKAFELAPFDLFMKAGKTYPLTEARFRQAMFRAEEFDVAKAPPPQKMLASDLTPPFSGQSGGYFGNAQLFDKQSMLQVLAPLMEQESVEKVARMVTEDPTVRARMRSSLPAAACLGYIAGSSELQKVAGGDMWEAVAQRIKPNVVQLEKLANGRVRVKYANSGAFLPQETEMEGDEAQALAGDEVQEMEPGDTQTISTDAAIKEQTTELEVEPIEQFGEWSVETLDGKRLIGWAFPHLLTFDMQPMPLTLFTNGSEYGLQEVVAGTRVGQGTNLPHANICGYGCLYYVSAGVAKATVPFTVKGQQGGEMDALLAGEEGMPEEEAAAPKEEKPAPKEANLGQVTYLVETDIGEELSFTLVPGIKVITPMGEGQYAVPDYFGFMPITGGLVKLVDDPAGFGKTAEARAIGSGGQVVSDGAVYSLRGAVFGKLASALYEFVPRSQAEFMMVVAGVHPTEVAEKLAAVGTEEGGVADLFGLRDIITLAEHREHHIKSAMTFTETVPPAQFLVKEAADLMAGGDASTVDAVLSLSFLTPETVSVFISYLPYLEDSVNRLADLLYATRTGLKILNESSVRTALFSLEETVNGLKLLAQT